jgi:DNA primase
MDYSLLLNSLEGVLGKSGKRARNNYAFHCPFCNHKKPKLEVQLVTNEKGENPWECWVCKTRGKTIRSLLRQLKVPSEIARDVLAYVSKGELVRYHEDDFVKLPEEFQPLFSASNESIIANKIRRYLKKRGITELDILKYNIGYCLTGDYEGRIIIPSYDENNQLNYFVGRSFENSYYKYKNPSASKDIIAFENFINWNLPIVLVEGVFDAIAAKRNAIPILGKSLSNSLLKKIVSNNVKQVYIALDSDALKEAITFCEQFLSMGKSVYLVGMDGKDPSEMGFEEFSQRMKYAPEMNMSLLMKYKLGL